MENIKLGIKNIREIIEKEKTNNALRDFEYKKRELLKSNSTISK